jgi:transcriptional regulator with XRE-family HTH domain
MQVYEWETAEEMDLALAKRLRIIRKRRGYSQETLSEMSGVSYGSLKRFESTGQISLLSLTKIAVALGCAYEIKRLFTDIPYRSIEEVIHEPR